MKQIIEIGQETDFENLCLEHKKISQKIAVLKRQLEGLKPEIKKELEKSENLNNKGLPFIRFVKGKSEYKVQTERRTNVSVDLKKLEKENIHLYNMLMKDFGVKTESEYFKIYQKKIKL